MFLQRSAAVVARRAVVSPMARRAFTTSIARCTTPKDATARPALATSGVMIASPSKVRKLTRLFAPYR
jgi:hypothetical protein